MADSDFALSVNAYAVRFFVWLHTSVGEQAVFRVVKLGWLH